MIALTLAFALPVQVTPVSPQGPEEDIVVTGRRPPQEDIVVIGRRLQRWQGVFNIEKDKYSCDVTQSTGDPQIDRIGCDAMRACLIPAMPRYDATRARGLDAVTRQRMRSAFNGEMSTCVTEKRKALIAELAYRRAGGGA